MLSVSLFLPWFGFSFGGSLSGFGAHGWLFLVLLACAGVLGYLVRLTVRPGIIPAPAHWQGLIAATGLSSFLTVIALLDSPSGSSLQVGAILALGAAGTSLAGAITTRHTLVRSGDLPPQGMNLITTAARLPSHIRTALEASSPARPAPLPPARSPTGPQPEAGAGPTSWAGSGGALVTGPTRQERSGPPAPSAADGNKQTPGRGRWAVPAVIWGAILAFLGWFVWLVSLWGPTHPTNAGQGYGQFGQAFQQAASAIGSAFNQALPNYHLDLAVVGVAVGFAVLIAVYVFTQVRDRRLAVLVLGITAVLVAIGALMVGSVLQLGSAISTADHVCNAARLGNCVPASAYAALLGGWMAVGGGGLALLGGVLCARSVTATRGTANGAIAAQTGLQAAFRAAETTRPSKAITAFSPMSTASSSLPDEAAARVCGWCHAPVQAGDLSCSVCGQPAGRGVGLP